MKKLISVILVVIFLVSCCTALAENDNTDRKYEQLTVGVTTAFSGNFLSDAIGTNISDQDVRKMIHAYHLVKWDGGEGVFHLNNQVVTSAAMSEDGETYMFTIARNLTYSDGTPITARDYAFSFLLLTSKALKDAAGLRQEGKQVVGWKEYDEGLAATVSGFRVIGDYQLMITISPEYQPYFYEMKSMDFYPLPIHVLAPGCEVKDDGDGIYLSGEFSEFTIQETILDPEKGYASHPSVTSGPYMMTGYDGKTVWLTANDEYIGDASGNKPQIEKIVVRYIPSRDLLSSLIVNDIDLTTRSIRTEQVTTGMALAGGDEYAMKSYSRNGLAFISFCAEKGPTADKNVRKALAMCIDKTGLNAEYSGNMGVVVDGYYGIGQWMFPMTRGMIPDAWKEKDPDDTFEDINLDRLIYYSLDTEAAGKLLDEAGWNLNAEGGLWTEGLRYKISNGKLVPLILKLAYPTENLSGPLLNTYFAPYLREAGAELVCDAINMPELLEMYYGTAPRDGYDMILMGSNFQDVYDPSLYYDENGYDRRNGILSQELASRARALRRTEPGDGAEYVRRWIKYLEFRSDILPEIPLYSNAYMDFHISALRDYAPSAFSSWSEAVLKAYLSDFVEEEEEEDSEWLGEGEVEFE